MIKEIDRIKGLIAFMTRIPVGNFHSDLEEISRYLLFILFIGMFIGFLGSLVALPFYYLEIDAPILVGTLVLFVMLYIQGFHHVDGLADYGDAWMVVGDARRKLEVMRDKYIGVGALIFVLFLEMISLASIGYLYSKLPFITFTKLIVVTEASSRLGLLVCACCGIPAKEGIGRYFVKSTDEYHLSLGYLIMIILSFLLDVAKIGILCSTVAVFFAMAVAKRSNSEIQCVTGDVLGATTEMTRAVVLLTTVLGINLFN
ncbi:MAG TPA: adenosylcobinamide-GDP ribazoletransferase [Methanothermococcus okinawensis]|uniref:Adenosylcobinamide-GDP ribazoletransferase n=1 Tax=Methanothermococcus okinawensis TaxID=155863 RepID=A0A833E6R7_9EURY|nr:adenosylcobinamide-GDP ribazoletransferase [Methanococcaceae archaeon]HIP84660.1 adenosylcobinamide-GDP ribazoletransferase [Methanothermococcus okinawensis]HIP91720.1 adenosylcobinamide-GDP ribazoletransferase [Methanothermococcus okinawensis]